MFGYATSKEGNVAPFVGAWIEIPDSRVSIYVSTVAPFVGAWIEIALFFDGCEMCLVAPFVGAWIEITSRSLD